MGRGNRIVSVIHGRTNMCEASVSMVGNRDVEDEAGEESRIDQFAVFAMDIFG